jgi:hypothetical protein
LLDSAAFKRVLGKGCSAPNQKCDRDRYKGLLASAVEATGVSPIFHGTEYAEKIAGEMDIAAVAKVDKGIAELSSGLKRAHEFLSRLEQSA